jgi:hypothetical protein
MKNKVSKKQLREFGLLIGFGIPIIIGWLLPYIRGNIFHYWTLWIGVFALLFSVIKPKFLFYPYKAWMTLGNVLGWINSRLVLGLIFFIILQPIAYLMRAIGYDPLRLKKGNQTSYREDKHNHSINLKRIF